MHALNQKVLSQIAGGKNMQTVLVSLIEGSYVTEKMCIQAKTWCQLAVQIGIDKIQTSRGSISEPCAAITTLCHNNKLFNEIIKILKGLND